MEAPRLRVFAALRETPGCNTRMIAERLDVDDSTANYHLRRLMEEGKVESHRNGREVCWFPKRDGTCPVLRQILPAFRREEVRAIARALGEMPVSAPRLEERTGVGRTRARSIILMLEGAGVVARTHMGYAHLVDGASTCIERALANEPCPLWGQCEVSKRLAASGR